MDDETLGTALEERHVVLPLPGLVAVVGDAWQHATTGEVSRSSTAPFVPPQPYAGYGGAQRPLRLEDYLERPEDWPQALDIMLRVRADHIVAAARDARWAWCISQRDPGKPGWQASWDAAARRLTNLTTDRLAHWRDAAERGDVSEAIRGAAEEDEAQWQWSRAAREPGFERRTGDRSA